MRGYDGAKKVKGRKRVELCDTQGNLLDAFVMPADVDERTCALTLLVGIRKSAWGRGLQTIFADAGFAGEEFEDSISYMLRQKIEIGRGAPDQKGFVPLPKRWLIEQLFGCQGRYRRLSRDYEGNTRISRATIQGVNIHRWLRRLKPTPSTDPPFRYRKAKSL